MVGLRHHGDVRSREARRNRWAVRGGVVPPGLVPAYDWYPNSLLEKDINQLRAVAGYGFSSILHHFAVKDFGGARLHYATHASSGIDH